MQIKSYKHHLLIAIPSLRGDFFAKSVIYLYEHSEAEGSIGFMVNKPLSATLGNVLDHLGFPILDEEAGNMPVYSGGPVGPDQGFVIHDRMSMAEQEEDEDITISTSREMLEEIGQGKGPDNFIVTLGYSGWGAGQLEQEIMRNDWLVSPFFPSIIFDVPIAERWTKAAQLMGVDLDNLSNQVGHA